MISKNTFYNATFNHLTPGGQSKFMWGFKDFDLTKDIKEQIIKSDGGFNLKDVYNFQLTAFNNVTIDTVTTNDNKE